MRIVHISDLHVGRFPRSPRCLFDKRLLGMLNGLLRRTRHYHGEYLDRALAAIRRLEPELVVCTGDNTTVGSPEEHEAAVERLQPLQISFGHRFVYIPGNHDAYVRDRLCREALRQAFRSLNSERWELQQLPVEMAMGGVRFFLLNASRPVSCLLSSGRATDDALAWMDRRLARPREPGEARVLLGHFPLRKADGTPLGRRRRMQGADRLWDHLQAGRIDLAMCGHIHLPFARWLPGGSGEVCAGSLTLNGCFSVVDWVPATGRFSQFFVDVTGNGTDNLPVEGDLAPVS